MQTSNIAENVTFRKTDLVPFSAPFRLAMKQALFPARPFVLLGIPADGIQTQIELKYNNRG
jgi:hypothetical protein